MFLVGRIDKPRLSLLDHAWLCASTKRLFPTCASALRTKPTLPGEFSVKNSFTHSLIHTYITQLPSFISFRGLAFEYCLYQIQTLVSPLNHGFSFFRTPRTDFKLRVSIFHTLSLIQSSVSPSVLL